MQEVVGSNPTDGKICFSHFTLLERNVKNCFVKPRAVATIGAGGAKAPNQSVCPPPHQTFGKLKYDDISETEISSGNYFYDDSIETPKFTNYLVKFRGLRP